MLTQFDILKSIPYPENPTALYYWTNVSYVDSADFDNQPQMILAVLQRERLIARANINFEGYTIKQPPGRGNIIFQGAYSTPQPGQLPAITDPYLLTIARWTLIDDLGRKSYRLVRYPLGADDIEAGKLSPTGFTRQQTSLNTWLATSIFRNSYGRVIETGSVSPLAHMWQLRHGTKRRRSTFWAP